MADGIYRIGVVGASSLAGKELADTLSESSFGASNFVLLDDDELTGTMTAAGDEAAFIQKLEAASFDGMDFAFFAGNAEVTRSHWQHARRAGASIIDLTDSLASERDAVVLAPWLEEALAAPVVSVSLSTSAVVPAHPVAVMLTLLAARLSSHGLKSMAATIMEPASEHGRAAMDELQQQTITLLSFQTLPKDQYDAQVAFNLLTGLGEAAKIAFKQVEDRIADQILRLGAGRLPEIALQLVQAPVFHGYTASVLIEMTSPMTVERVQAGLSGAHIHIVTADAESPSNLSAAGHDNLLVRVTSAGESGTKFWIWTAADNLRLRALTAVACATALKVLRPKGEVQ